MVVTGVESFGREVGTDDEGENSGSSEPERRMLFIGPPLLIVTRRSRAFLVIVGLSRFVDLLTRLSTILKVIKGKAVALFVYKSQDEMSGSLKRIVAARIL